MVQPGHTGDVRRTAPTTIAPSTRVEPSTAWRLRLLWIGVSVFAVLLLVSLLSLVLR